MAAFTDDQQGLLGSIRTTSTARHSWAAGYVTADYTESGCWSEARPAVLSVSSFAPGVPGEPGVCRELTWCWLVPQDVCSRQAGTAPHCLTRTGLLVSRPAAASGIQVCGAQPSPAHL